MSIFVHIGEAGLVLQEAQIDIRDRTVTVLGDDDLGHTRRRHTVLVLIDTVIFGTMDESHDVGVLLDGSRFAQVRKLGAFRTAAQLRSTAQLRELL